MDWSRCKHRQQPVQQPVAVFREILFFIDDAAFVITDAGWNIKLFVHVFDMSDQSICGWLKSQESSNFSIAFVSFWILAVVFDNFWQIHCVCASMNNVTTAVCSTGFVCHGMNDTQQSIGECHTSQTLCVVHACTSFHVAIIAATRSRLIILIACRARGSV